jgi:hypothetical protein
MKNRSQVLGGAAGKNWVGKKWDQAPKYKSRRYNFDISLEML